MLMNEHSRSAGLTSRNADNSGTDAQKGLFFESLINESPLICFRREGQALNLTYISSNIERLLGWKAEERLGESQEASLSRLSLADQQSIRDQIRKVLAGQDAEIYYRSRTRNGTDLWMYSFLRNQTVDPSHPVITGYLLDASKLKQAEAAHALLEEHNERWEKVFRNASSLILISRPNGQVIDLNNATLQTFGYSREEFLQHGLIALEIWVRPEERQTFVEALQAQPQAHYLETQMRTKDGRHIDIIGTSEIITLHDEQVILSIFSNVTEQKNLQRVIRNSELRFRLLAEKASDMISHHGPDGTYLYTSPSSQALSGYTPEDLVGRSPFDFFHPDDQVLMQAALSELREIKNKNTKVISYRFRRKDGSYFWCESNIQVTRDVGTGELLEMYIISRDITERKDAEAIIRHQALHDTLTGLPNRALFHDRLEQALREALRIGETIGVIFLDLDHFKVINDTLGHAVGDTLLLQAGQRLRQCIRDSDTVARFGGDEFAILLRQLSHPEGSTKVVETILERFREPFVLQEKEYVITMSVGIALCPHSAKSASVLLKQADTAMYQAKEAGKNTYALYDEKLGQAINEQLRLESEFYKALQQQEFVLYYQPQINPSSGRVTVAEVLVRWQHPELGLLMPDRFMPLAERSGLIIELGAWVLREACRQNLAWHQAGLTRHRIAVNISARQFARNDLVDTVKAALDASGLASEYLELEFNEILVMKNFETALAQMRKLKAVGVKITIDDFGVGYTNLAQLRRLPVDKLKIDRSFMQHNEHESNNFVLVQTISVMAHSLGLKVSAEGVETPEQHAFLRGLTPSKLQGFLFSEPLSPAAYECFMHEFRYTQPPTKDSAKDSTQTLVPTPS